MIELNQDAKIFIQCPAGLATGGPEALHQLGHYLNKIGFNALMYYVASNHSDPVHPQYKSYNVPFTFEVENSSNHLLIIPESNLYPIYQKAYSRMKKAIWWLSVSYYWECLEPWKEKIKKKKFYALKSIINPHINPPLPTPARLRKLPLYHIRHSYFSEVFLKSNNISISGKISDYMNAAFFDRVLKNQIKEDIILYNPKKNGAFLESVISKSSHLNWVAVKNLTADGVADLMNRSKVYVDFGFHPGKERMPREACIMKCIMIIGRDGSAQYSEDMPIPDVYRFEKDPNKIDEIITLIEDCFKNYDDHIQNFVSYKAELGEEEHVFEKDIRKVFHYKN
jgi:hypothetical protein